MSPARCPAGLSTRPGAASAPSLGIFSAGKAGESRGAQAGGEPLWEALAWVWQPGAAAELLQAGLTLCCRAGARSLQAQPGNPSFSSPGPQRGGGQAMPSSGVRLQHVAVGGKNVILTVCGLLLPSVAWGCWDARVPPGLSGGCCCACSPGERNRGSMGPVATSTMLLWCSTVCRHS